MRAALGDQLLAAVLAQQLLQHVIADALLDAALLPGIEVHIAGHVAHLVGEDLQRLAGLQRHGDLVHAHGVQQGAVGGGQHMAVLKQDLAGGGIGNRHRQLLAPGAGPDGQLLVELVPAHHGQVVAAGIKEQALQQRLRGIHRGGLAGTQLAVDLQQRLLVGLAGILLQRGHDAAVIGDVTFLVMRHIVVHADIDGLAFRFQIINGLLIHSYSPFDATNLTRSMILME